MLYFVKKNFSLRCASTINKYCYKARDGYLYIKLHFNMHTAHLHAYNNMNYIGITTPRNQISDNINIISFCGFTCEFFYSNRYSLAV